jgi:hypothetical protein
MNSNVDSSRVLRRHNGLLLRIWKAKDLQQLKPCSAEIQQLEAELASAAPSIECQSSDGPRLLEGLAAAVHACLELLAKHQHLAGASKLPQQPLEAICTLCSTFISVSGSLKCDDEASRHKAAAEAMWKAGEPCCNSVAPGPSSHTCASMQQHGRLVWCMLTLSVALLLNTLG